jgi:hypothetical protein
MMEACGVTGRRRSSATRGTALSGRVEPGQMVEAGVTWGRLMLSAQEQDRAAAQESAMQDLRVQQRQE